MRERIKQFIWNFFPYELEMTVRFLLDSRFRKRQKNAAQRVGGQVAKIKRCPQKGKIRVVFFCYSPEMWNTCMSPFQEALRDDGLEVYILALPPKIPEENFEFLQEVYGENQSYAYCVSFCPDTINAYDPQRQTWFDLRTLSPDYVILSRPYDKEVCPQYQSEVLAEYTKLCYIPYAYCKMNWDSRLVYNPDFLKCVYAVFAESKEYARTLQRVYTGLFHAQWKKVVYTGYTKFDLHSGMEQGNRTFEKTVLWLPRWTTRELLEPSTFFQYKDQLIQFFREHPQFRLICRPHPMMFTNFASTGEMTEAEIADFKKLFATTGNLILDETGNHISAFTDADIFISDTSSLLVEEFITGKPIIFCGSMKHFDRRSKRWAREMYHATSWDNLSSQLKKLLSGIDYSRQKRQQVAEELLSFDGKSGERIVEFIKKDYFSGVWEKERTV